jgi:hypothetical protein
VQHHQCNAGIRYVCIAIITAMPSSSLSSSSLPYHHHHRHRHAIIIGIIIAMHYSTISSLAPISCDSCRALIVLATDLCNDSMSSAV